QAGLEHPAWAAVAADSSPASAAAVSPPPPPPADPPAAAALLPPPPPAPPPPPPPPLPLSPMMTVGHPIATGSEPPQASMTLSPIRTAGRLLMRTVALPLVTKPGPCGGMGQGMGQTCISAMLAIEEKVDEAAAAAAA